MPVTVANLYAVRPKGIYLRPSISFLTLLLNYATDTLIVPVVILAG